MVLINSRHFNVGLLQMLIKLLRTNKFTISLDNFDPKSFMKIESWMITFVKRHMEIDSINKNIEVQHRGI